MSQSNSLSLRVRLTLWYGTALALILVVFAAVLYFVMARALNDQVDRSLEESALAAVRSLMRSELGPFFQFEDLSHKFPELAVLDKFFQILGPTGRTNIKSPNIISRDIPLTPTTLTAAREGSLVFESVRYPNAPPLRVVSVPIISNGQLISIVRVGTSLRPVKETLDRLLLVLLIMMPVGLVVALAGGWFLAARALRPVESITRAAERIAEGDLSQRLSAPQSSDEIGRLAATFNKMIARLDASFRQVRQFGTDASHELRTPLTVLKGETELALRRDRTAEDYRQVLESGLEEIDHMTSIVDELFFLSRADLGEVKMESLPVRLDSLLEDVHRQASVLGQESGIQVVLMRAAPCTVLGDELRLRELLLNLVDNAVKYSQPNGKVELDLMCDGHAARLSVRDQGIGVEPEALPRIFDRFYRSDSARAHAKIGTGLGLAICRWIVEAHHGQIDVQSVPGHGSAFTVVLPSAPSKA